MPPTFVLSQDQTLKFDILFYKRSIHNSRIPTGKRVIKESPKEAVAASNQQTIEYTTARQHQHPTAIHSRLPPGYWLTNWVPNPHGLWTIAFDDFGYLHSIHDRPMPAAHTYEQPQHQPAGAVRSRHNTVLPAIRMSKSRLPTTATRPYTSYQQAPAARRTRPAPDRTPLPSPHHP
jgi:hypothetical protein